MFRKCIVKRDLVRVMAAPRIGLLRTNALDEAAANRQRARRLHIEICKDP